MMGVAMMWKNRGLIPIKLPLHPAFHIKRTPHSSPFTVN